VASQVQLQVCTCRCCSTPAAAGFGTSGSQVKRSCGSHAACACDVQRALLVHWALNMLHVVLPALIQRSVQKFPVLAQSTKNAMARLRLPARDTVLPSCVIPASASSSLAIAVVFYYS